MLCKIVSLLGNVVGIGIVDRTFDMDDMISLGPVDGGPSEKET